MKKPRVRMDYSTMSDGDLYTFAQVVVVNMTNSATIFPDPNPTLVILGQQISAYSAALTKAASRDKTAILQKDEERGKLLQLLADLAAYVTSAAGGDEAKLSASGFHLVKQAEPTPPIDTPQNFQVVAGVNAGEVVLSVDRAKGAKSYIFQLTVGHPTAESVWQVHPTSTRKVVVSNLDPGKVYSFRVIVVGARGQLVYSNSQEKMVA